MKPSPLQLEHYFFAESHCKALHHSGSPDDLPFGAVDPDHFSTDVKMFKGESDPKEYQIHLEIRTNNEAEPDLPYRLLIHAIGYFKVDPEYDHDRIDHLVQINGASVLYSACRDFALTLTSRGPWGPLMLPTVNFRISQSKSGADAVADH